MAPDTVRLEVALAIVLMWTAALRLVRVALERQGEGSESRSFLGLLRDRLSASQRKDGKAPPDHGESVRPSRGQSSAEGDRDGDDDGQQQLEDLAHFLTEAPSRGCPASDAEANDEANGEANDEAGETGDDEGD